MGLNDLFKRIGGQNTNDTYDGTDDEDYYNEFDGYDNQNQDADDQQGGANQRDGGQNYGQSAGYGAAGGYQGVQGGIYGAGGVSLSGSAIEIKVVKPERFESGALIADHLLNKRTVFINFENTNKETARRLIDFLSGVAYSIKGEVRNIANNVYIITPNNVDVSNEALRERRRREQPADTDIKGADDASYGDFN
jgi:cell division inhibitor SepF